MFLMWIDDKYIMILSVKNTSECPYSIYLDIYHLFIYHALFFPPQYIFLPPNIKPSKHFFLNNWFLPKMIHHLSLKAGFPWNQELEHTLLSHIFGKGTFAQSRMKNLGPLHRTWTLASFDIKTSPTSFCFNNTFMGGGWTTTQI